MGSKMRSSLDRISVVMFSGNTGRKYVLDSIHSYTALSTWTTYFKIWVYPYNPKLCPQILCWHTLNYTAANFSASKEQKWARHIFIHATQKEMGETSFYPSLVGPSELQVSWLPQITPILFLCVYVRLNFCSLYPGFCCAHRCQMQIWSSVLNK